MSKIKSNTPFYYPFIDGFRAIAIVMVLLHHARRGFDLDHMYQNSVIVLEWIYFKSKEYLGLDLTKPYQVLEQIAIKLKGILGIEMFFVISGFLITTILLKETLNWRAIKEFYLKRLFKIYPTYVLMVIVSLIVMVILDPAAINNFWIILLSHLFFYAKLCRAACYFWAYMVVGNY